MTEKDNENIKPDGVYGEQPTYDFTTDREFYKNIFQITKRGKIFLYFYWFYLFFIKVFRSI